MKLDNYVFKPTVFRAFVFALCIMGCNLFFAPISWTWQLLLWTVYFVALSIDVKSAQFYKKKVQLRCIKLDWFNFIISNIFLLIFVTITIIDGHQNIIETSGSHHIWWFVLLIIVLRIVRYKMEARTVVDFNEHSINFNHDKKKFQYPYHAIEYTTLESNSFIIKPFNKNEIIIELFYLTPNERQEALHRLHTFSEKSQLSFSPVILSELQKKQQIRNERMLLVLFIALAILAILATVYLMVC